MRTHGGRAHERTGSAFPRWTVLVVALVFVALLPFVVKAEIAAGGRVGRL